MKIFRFSPATFDISRLNVLAGLLSLVCSGLG